MATIASMSSNIQGNHDLYVSLDRLNRFEDNGVTFDEIQAADLKLFVRPDITLLNDMNEKETNQFCMILGLPDQIDIIYAQLRSCLPPSHTMSIIRVAHQQVANLDPCRLSVFCFSDCKEYDKFIDMYLCSSNQSFVAVKLNKFVCYNHNENTPYNFEGQLLPYCTYCISRIRSSISKLQTSSLIMTPCVSTCRVCQIVNGSSSSSSSTASSPSSSTRACLVCKLNLNLWICLICGSIGCGRYTSQHAQQHYLDTKHSFSLELVTGRIWDYDRDTFVHSESTLPLNSIRHVPAGRESAATSAESDILSPDVTDKLEALSSYYESLLRSQLIDQELYYEKLLARETFQALENSHKSTSSGHRTRDNFSTRALGLETTVDNVLFTDDDNFHVEKLKIEISGE